MIYQYLDYVTQIRKSIDFAWEQGREIKKIDMTEQFYEFMDEQNKRLATIAGKSLTFDGIPIEINNNVSDFEIILK